MKKNFVPFTKTDYPNGFSRKDCQSQLLAVMDRIQSLRKQLKAATVEAKQFQKQLKDGGYTE